MTNTRKPEPKALCAGQARVLIADGDYQHAELLYDFLRAARSQIVDLALDAPDLWAHLRAKTYDVIILNPCLPEGDGLELLAQMAARGCQTPVIIVTAQREEAAVQQALARGAAACVVKRGEYVTAFPALIQQALSKKKWGAGQ